MNENILSSEKDINSKKNKQNKSDDNSKHSYIMQNILGKEDSIKYIQQSYKIKLLAFFISEYGFILIIIFLLLIFLCFPKYHKPKTFISKKSNIFNSHYVPKIFLHLTDLHITLNRPNKLDGSLIFLNSILKYNADLILMTGDIVDNFEGKRKWQRVGIQNKNDWNVYKKTVKNMLSNYNVIDVAGNHDVWGVDSVLSNNNIFLDYSFMFNRTNVKNEDDFTLKKVKIFNYTFILLNDYRFPTARPPYGAESYTNKHQLDLLENMIDNLDEEECYILTHYNIDRIWYESSSKGHTFEEIISKKKVGAIFTGHKHPNEVRIIHHGKDGGLEFCTSSTFDKKRAGLISIDNNNLIYHDVEIPFPGEGQKFFLTYPVPDEQISSHHIFNLYEFEIRVLSYINDTNIKLKIKGDINGEMKYSMTLKNGAILYSFPIHLDKGTYKIYIYDENGYNCNINTKFTLGDEFKGKKEKALNSINFYLILRFSSIFFFLFLFIIINPIECNKFKFKIIEKIENYINGKNNNKNINSFLWLFLIFLFNPFILRKRFQNINKVVKYTIFCGFIYPLILPIHFFDNIEGKIGFVFNISIVIGSSIKYEHFSLQITYIYYLTIIFPYVIFLSGINYYRQHSIIKYFNYFTTIILFLFGFFINFYSMAQSLSLKYLFFSTGYIINWTIIFIISYIYISNIKLVKLKKKLIEEENINYNSQVIVKKI